MKNIFKLSPSPVTLKRLAEYLCHLVQLSRNEYSKISSSQLARMMSAKPSRLRQDFHYFGGFGQPGHPYDASYLTDELKKVFGLNESINLLIYGATSMTKVIIEHRLLPEFNINIKGIIEPLPKSDLTEFSGYTIIKPSEVGPYVSDNPIHIGVICTPEPEAGVKLFTANGINSIWNLSHKYVTPQKGITIVHENITAGLLTLVYAHKNK